MGAAASPITSKSIGLSLARFEDKIFLFGHRFGASMLKVQEFLIKHPKDGLAKLKEYYDIDHKFDNPNGPVDPIVILNYSQIGSPKNNEIVRECRGLVLELGTWAVVARSFYRFFNLGENEKDTKEFVWEGSQAQSKEDGSLIHLYNYRDEWRVNTRNSFGEGPVNCDWLLEDKIRGEHVFPSWKNLLFIALGLDTRDPLDFLDVFKDWTFVIELCSPYNMIVTPYQEPQAFLLTAVNRVSGVEMPMEMADMFTWVGKLKRPKMYNFASSQDVLDYLKEESVKNPTFEGFVCKDKNGIRIKVKSESYVRLHKLHNNGNILLIKSMIPIILANETAEVLSYFPHFKPQFDKVEEWLARKEYELWGVWRQTKDIEVQKDFALEVQRLLYESGNMALSSVLFNARKSGDMQLAFRGAEVPLIKMAEGKLSNKTQVV